MPKHFAVNQNIQYYTIDFDNTKTVELTYDNAFPKKPMVQLTPNDSASFPVYKTQTTTTGVKIKFKTPWTGSVDVIVMER